MKIETSAADLLRHQAIDDGEDFVEMRATFGILVPAFEHQSVHLWRRSIGNRHSVTCNIDSII